MGVNIATSPHRSAFATAQAPTLPASGREKDYASPLPWFTYAVGLTFAGGDWTVRVHIVPMFARREFTPDTDESCC